MLCWLSFSPSSPCWSRLCSQRTGRTSPACCILAIEAPASSQHLLLLPSPLPTFLLLSPSILPSPLPHIPSFHSLCCIAPSPLLTSTNHFLSPTHSGLAVLSKNDILVFKSSCASYVSSLHGRVSTAEEASRRTGNERKGKAEQSLSCSIR